MHAKERLELEPVRIFSASCDRQHYLVAPWIPNFFCLATAGPSFNVCGISPNVFKFKTKQTSKHRTFLWERKPDLVTWDLKELPGPADCCQPIYAGTRWCRLFSFSLHLFSNHFHFSFLFQLWMRPRFHPVVVLGRRYTVNSYSSSPKACPHPACVCLLNQQGWISVLHAVADLVTRGRNLPMWNWGYTTVGYNLDALSLFLI